MQNLMGTKIDTLAISGKYKILRCIQRFQTGRNVLADQLQGRAWRHRHHLSRRPPQADWIYM